MHDAHEETFQWIYGHPPPRDGGRENHQDTEISIYGARMAAYLFESDEGSDDRPESDGGDDCPESDDSDDSSESDDGDDAPETYDRERPHLYPSIEDPMKVDARNRIVYWLTSGGGIFHVCGKLGSGKSTLMKYLCEQSATKDMLSM